MAEVKRKKSESFESLLRRFNKRIQQSGRMLEARKLRFHDRIKSKNAGKASALRRLQIAEKRQYLERIGQLPEETRRGRRR
ncbi:MAG: 30S ribosomal protein S21 [Candidatus Uhrbacteria bacterium]|nr:30S ribosomal protein S21 [Patescibacteria group bacterium]MBU1907375.1 30S ribosomal protein S21 [Patescibacteria group bacterium]